MKFKRLRHLHFYCQKVLPLVYDDSLSYYELLCKVVNTLNELISNDSEMQEAVEELQQAMSEVQDMLDGFQDDIQAQFNQLKSNFEQQFNELEIETQNKITQLQGEVDKKFSSLESELRNEINTFRNQLLSDIREIKEWIDNFDYERLEIFIQETINDWIEDSFVSMIFVTIEEDGHFHYYIPRKWSEIVFNTTGYDIDIKDTDFGRLVLSLNV